MKASPSRPPTAKLTRKSVILLSLSVLMERVRTPIREIRLIKMTLIIAYIQAMIAYAPVADHITAVP